MQLLIFLLEFVRPNAQEAIAPFVIPLAIAAIQLGKSFYDQSKAQSGLNELNSKGRPNYEIAPEFQKAYDEAIQLAKYGRPAQEANYQQQLSRSENTAYERSVARAPGLSQQLLGGINYTNINAQNQHAAFREDQHMKDIMYAHSIARAIQQQKNLASGANIDDYNRQQQAYGQAIAQQKQNQFNILNQAGYYGTSLLGGAGGATGTGNRVGTPNDPAFSNRAMQNINTPELDFRTSYYNPDIDMYERARKYSLNY